MGKSFETFKQTAFLRLYTFAKIPLLWWIRPSVIENSQTRTILKVPLIRKTQNHLKSMYFGALAMGAEGSVALQAVEVITKCGHKIDYIFKDFNAVFLKRAEGDVHFVCDQGPQVRALVDKCILSGERETATFEGYALVPKKDPNQRVMEYKITLSVKKRN